MSEQTSSEQTSSGQGVAMVTAAVVKRDDETVVVGLEQGLPRSAVKKHPHSGFDYVDPVYVINTANEVFGYGGWSDEIVVAPHVVKEYTRQKGSGPGSVTNLVAIVACTVRVKAIGTQHDGQGMGTADGPIDTFAGNLDKAFKEAATDAMKRAFIKFGDRFALTLYTKDAASRNIVDDGAPGSGSANGAASSSAGGAAAAGGGFAPPVPQIPDINANPVAHYIARLKTARSQAEYGEIFQTGLRQTHPAIENEVWEATRSYYDTLPASAPAAPPADSGKSIAPDSDLDSQYGDPKVFTEPRGWNGESRKGWQFSACEPEYLDLLAAMLDKFASTETDEKKKGFKLKDAARARGWARRLRSGWKRAA